MVSRLDRLESARARAPGIRPDVDGRFGIQTNA